MGSSDNKSSVIVIRRRLRKIKTATDVAKETRQNIDPSYESEKPKNPLDFVKTSYGKVLQAIPLKTNLTMPISVLFDLFGEPTRILKNSMEWAIKIPTKEVLKIVYNSNNNRVSIHGFNYTRSINKWVQRFLNL